MDGWHIYFSSFHSCHPNQTLIPWIHVWIEIWTDDDDYDEGRVRPFSSYFGVGLMLNVDVGCRHH